MDTPTNQPIPPTFPNNAIVAGQPPSACSCELPFSPVGFGGSGVLGTGNPLLQ
jgi:hypothetical protein